MNIGYYYCSLSTFLNIINTREIFLSDPLKMNDSLELQWYLGLLHKEEDEMWSRLDKLVSEDMNEDPSEYPETDASEEKTEYHDTVFERMRERSGVNFSYQDFIKILQNGQRSVYICCFSHEGDLLSQWRAYADDGQGVSLGFDLDQLCTQDNVYVKDILYTDKVVQEGAEPDVEIAADGMLPVFNDDNVTETEKEKEEFLHELLAVLARYKNPAFKEEKEVRLIYDEDPKFDKILNKYGAFNRPVEFAALKHDFRASGQNDITEFVRLPFEPTAFHDVWIGPKCRLTENDVKVMVSEKLGNIHIKVRKSGASYR